MLMCVQKRLFLYESRSLPRIATILDPRFKKDGFRMEENGNCGTQLLEEEMALINHNTRINQNNNDSTRNECCSNRSLLSFMEKKIKKDVERPMWMLLSQNDNILNNQTQLLSQTH
jgi:hypothetical protein